MKKIKLGNIADIQTGLVLARAGAKQLELIKADLSEKVSSAEAIDYKAVTLRSINELGEINFYELDNFKSTEEIKPRYLTEKNDVLIRLFTPVKSCFIGSNAENLIVPSQFGIIKIKQNFISKVLPEYLHVCILQKEFSNQLQKYEEGFQLRSVRTSSIAKIEISIPSILEQEKIINVHYLMKEKEKLSQKLYEQEKIYNEVLMTKLLKGEIV